MVTSRVPIRWLLPEFLKENNITQRALAIQAGIAEPHISRLKSARRYDADTLDRILEALSTLIEKDVRIEQILEWTPRSKL
jgi:transcriptional regulator with XRE-family HTH domain